MAYYEKIAYKILLFALKRTVRLLGFLFFTQKLGSRGLWLGFLAFTQKFGSRGP